MVSSHMGLSVDLQCSDNILAVARPKNEESNTCRSNNLLKVENLNNCIIRERIVPINEKPTKSLTPPAVRCKDDLILRSGLWHKVNRKQTKHVARMPYIRPTGRHPIMSQQLVCSFCKNVLSVKIQDKNGFKWPFYPLHLQ